MAIKFLNTVQVDTDVLYVNTANDRVGIGTDNPSVTLHVDGFARLNGGLQMNATNAQIYQILDSDLRFGTNNTERMRIDNTGNVGIGTTSPSYKLTSYSTIPEGDGTDEFPIVAGKANAIGNFTGIGLASYIAANGAVKAGIALERVSSYGTGKLHFLNSDTLSNSDATLSDSKMTILRNGNVGIGTTSPGAKLHVSGGNLLFDAQYGVRFVDGNTRIYTNSDSPEDLIIEADQDLLLNPDRNLGIGTTSPSEKLEVAGKVFINGQIYGGFGSKTTSGTLDWDDSTNARSGNGHTLLRGNATNGPAGAEYYHPFSWEYASYDNDGNMTQFAIPYSTNNTGMYYRSRYNGTWTDWAEIVTTTKTLPGGPYLPLAGGTMTGNTLHGDGVKSMYGAGNDLQIYHNGSNSLIEQSGTGKLILDTTSTGINIQSGVGETRFTKSGASSEIKVDDASQVNKVVLRASGNSYLNGGNVGIGTTSPSASLQIGSAVATSSEKLDVRGNSSANYVASFEQDHATGYGVLIDTDGTLVSEPALRVKNTASDLFYIGSNGNVGIGTTSPAYRLDVSGGARFTGDIVVSGGDINLGGTGRIQGVDNVLAGTDATNRNYVDNAIAGVPQGDITAVVAGTGLTGGGTSGSVTLNVASNTYTPYNDIRSLGVQAFTNGANPNITTAQVMAEIESDGGFDSYSSVFKTSWSYAGNYNLTDAGDFTETAGSSWITWTDNSSDTTRGNITALAIAPTTGGSAGGVFIYNDQGSSYSPGWRQVWTSTTDGAGSGLDADLLDGQQGSYYLDYANFTGTPTIPSVGNGQIDGRTSGLGLSGSMDATANQSGDTTFTVTSNAATAANANTIAYRTSSADIRARLFRSNYANQTTISGGMAFRVNNGADDYIRFCTDKAAIRTFLGVPASGDLNSYLLNTTDTFTGALTIAGDIRGSGQQLILNAGEAYNSATGQTNEYVYINAEQGLEVNSSPDNWASGWAGRNTTTIGKADGTSSFSGKISVQGSNVIEIDQTYSYLNHLKLLSTFGSKLFSATNYGYVLESSSTPADPVTFRFDNDRYRIYSGSSGEALTVLANTNVGIGTTSPVGRLEVVTTDANRYIRFKAPNGEERFQFYTGGTGNPAGQYMYDADGTTRNVQISAGGTSYFNGGNIGIGTTSPGAKLDVTGSYGDVIKAVSGSQNITTNFVAPSTGSGLNNITSTAGKFNIGTTDAQPFDLVTSSISRISIISTGKVGINNTNPTYQLHVSGNAGFTGQTTHSSGLVTSSTQTRNKISVWNSLSSYTIGMKGGFGYGGLGGDSTGTNYAMSFQMSDTTDRGWWWGDTTHTDVQGSMSLTTDGELVVAKSLSVGAGETTRTAADRPLEVTGNALIDGRLTIEGPAPMATSPMLELHRTSPVVDYKDLNSAGYFSLKERFLNSGSTVIGSREVSQNPGGSGIYHNFDNGASGGSQFHQKQNSFHWKINSTSEKLTLGTNGYIGINDTSPSYQLDVNGSGRFTSTVTATNFILSSDERLKENVKKVCDNRVKADWKTFELKTDKGQKRYGVIAQELEKTNPEFVREDSQGFKSVAYIDLLIAKIAELEARLEKLEK